MKRHISRRGFLKVSGSGVAAIVIGSKLPFLGVENAHAATPATQALSITITDCMKDMVTHNSVNVAQCYFWIYKMAIVDVADPTKVLVDIPPECPGPTIYAIKGDTISISITNDLDEPHSFFIPGNLPGDPPIFDSGVIPAKVNGVATTVGPFTFTATTSGAHMYQDNLNAPVNRSMGLHGALVVRPKAAAPGHNFTPYDNPSAHVQNLYDMFGTQFWPGLKWEEGDVNSNCPPFRQYVWLYHMASPRLQAEVGNLPPGVEMSPQDFMRKIARDPFSPTRNNNLPTFYTVNGQSGFFSHFDPAITPISRVGEPVVIHILHAGVQSVSHHMHCNHFFVTSNNGVPNPNPIWVDIYGIKPMERVDYTFPFMRPPDNANVRGIGRPDTPLRTSSGSYCWPPQEEMQTFYPPDFQPAVGTPNAPTDINGVPLNMGQRLSPLCYPAHDHLETSQTAQGGNYNCGLITGAYVLGDRNALSQGLGDWMNFPMDADFFRMFRNIRGLAVDGVNGTREAAGPRTAAG
jgi:FtsP/CotA-like multicopper oxidase with cupredoxin domain